MATATIRKAVVAVCVLAAVVLLAIVALPWFASTQIVRDRIAYELSVWSGYRVALGEAPELDVWPSFRATLRDVEFHQWSGEDTLPVLEADSLEVSMSALSALSGKVVLSGVVMQRPLLRLTKRGSVIDLPPSPGGGRMVRAVDAARGVVSENPGNPDRAALPADRFGTVEFVDGRIAISRDDDQEVVSSLSGKVDWASLNRPASLTASGIWRGENVRVEAASTQPLMLLAGGSAPVTATLRSPLLELSFDGQANLSTDAFFDGKAKLATPSLKRMLEWSRTEIAPGAAIGAMSIESRVQGTAQRLKLDAVRLRLSEDVGTGVLDLAFTEPIPSISGTLAFDRLDLGSFLSAFTPLSSGTISLDDPIDTDFLRQLSVDLRLSAKRAVLGSTTLEDVAATTQVKGSLAVFDVSDATAFGGNVQAGIRIDAAPEGGQSVEFRMMADDVDALALAKAAGAGPLLPEARANLSAILKGSGDNWATVLGGAEGSVAATLGPGAIAGLDLAAFRQRSATGGFFALDEVSNGRLPMKGLDFKAKVSNGVARIERADILMENEAVSLTGIVPYFGRALALSGHFAPLGPGGARGEPAETFFIGGAWDTPYISPVIDVPFE